MKKNRVIIHILFLCMINIMILTGCKSKEMISDTNKNKVIQELDYLDGQIIGILNKLNNITLENYTVTSEETSLTESTSTGGDSGNSGSSGGSNSSGSSDSSRGGSNQSSGVEQKQSSSQSGNSEDKSSITASQMESKTILESDENDTDWSTIKSEIEKISNSWAIILLDLSNFNIDSNDALSFSSTLDDCILSIKDENKADALTNLAKLYSFIPKYETAISADNSVQNIKQVKSYLINSYSGVEQENWNDIEFNMSECEKTYKNIMNDIEYVKDKEVKVNRTYVLIKELQNSLRYKDKKIFYIKYKNLIESINAL